MINIFSESKNFTESNISKLVKYVMLKRLYILDSYIYKPISLEPFKGLKLWMFKKWTSKRCPPLKSVNISSFSEKKIIENISESIFDKKKYCFMPPPPPPQKKTMKNCSLSIRYLTLRFKYRFFVGWGGCPNMDYFKQVRGIYVNYYSDINSYRFGGIYVYYYLDINS